MRGQAGEYSTSCTVARLHSDADKHTTPPPTTQPTHVQHDESLQSTVGKTLGGMVSGLLGAKAHAGCTQTESCKQAANPAASMLPTTLKAGLQKAGDTASRRHTQEAYQDGAEVDATQGRDDAPEQVQVGVDHSGPVAAMVWGREGSKGSSPAAPGWHQTLAEEAWAATAWW